ncbi:MAG: substrate-binding domain-containing protein [Luteitalea sp.]|nr:substrate-binding domain-containing protein [Luteitalea sp.]
MSARKRVGPTRPSRPAGIREIAKALNVSIGTVDRALHDRGRISPLTRRKVLRMAERLGYRPNLAARYLSSKREMRIAYCLPREVASFFELVADGITAAAGALEASGVVLVHHSYSRLGHGEARAVERALTDDIHGLIIAPGRPDRLEPLIHRAASRGIPTLCVSTDAPNTERLAAVSVDPTTSGSLVAELMGRFLKGSGKVIVVTGSLNTMDHAGKLEGFRRATDEIWPNVRIASIVEAHDNEAEAYDKCLKVLTDQPDVAGVYVSTANSLPVIEAIERRGLSEVTLITTDLFPALVPLIESGRIAATMHQRAWTQGRVALQNLHRFLVEHISPPDHVRLSPHIVMKSNLKLFLDRIQQGRESGFRIQDSLRNLTE